MYDLRQWIHYVQLRATSQVMYNHVQSINTEFVAVGACVMTSHCNVHGVLFSLFDSYQHLSISLNDLWPVSTASLLEQHRCAKSTYILKARLTAAYNSHAAVANQPRPM